jgi:hypothetical protein
MDETIRNSISTFSTVELQCARRALENEMLEAVRECIQGTMTHAGKLELLAAIGAELDKRGHLLPVPHWQEVDTEDGHRLSFSVRVF